MVPVLFPLLCLIAGILASPYLDPNSVWLCLPLAFLLALARRPFALLTIFLLGAGLSSRKPPVPAIPETEAVRLTGELAHAPDWRGLGVYLDVDLTSIDGRPYHGRARLTEFLDDAALRELFNGLDLGSGDRLEILVKLHRPISYRNPGAFDFRRYLERQGIYWTGTIRNPRLITVQSRGWHASDAVLTWVHNRLDRQLPADRAVAGLVKGMVLGEKYELTADVERRFQAGGLYHLVVVSGFNLAVIAVAAGGLSRRLPWKRATRLLFVASSTLVYAAIVQGGTPVTRATIMALLLILGKLLDRGYSAFNAAAASAFLILFSDPAALEDSSFQMTFGAIFSVLAIGGPAARWAFEKLDLALQNFSDESLDGRLPPEIADWRVSRRLWCELHRIPHACVTAPWRLARSLGEAFLVATAAEIVMAVFMIESFHRLSPLSPIMNVPAGLIAAAVTPLGLVMILLPAPIAALVGWVVYWMSRLLLALPAISVRVPSAPLWLWIVYAGIVAIAVWAIAFRRLRPASAAFLGIVAVQYTMLRVDFSPKPPNEVVLTFLDVGQGDSILVEYPDGRRMLVDGGGVAAGRFLNLRDESTFSIGEDVVSQYLFSRRIRRLDAVVLTHAHNDHLDGLFEVVQNFQIGEAWLGRNPLIPRYREFLSELGERGIPIRWVKAGQMILGTEVLHPPADWKVRKTAQNNDSVVLLIRFGQRTALLTGDLETDLVGAPDHVDVLKVPHHGSRTTRLKVKAPIRVISVGANNPFGHPDVSKLPALRTDTLGAITVRMAEDRVQVE